MLFRTLRYFSKELNAGKASSLTPGSMKALEYNGDKNAVVVYNTNGSFYATGGKCSHYGGPLIAGAFLQGKVYCPWHCACFDVKSGSKETSPGLQSLPTYATEVNSHGDLIVKLPADVADPSHCPEAAVAGRDPSDQRKFVIIGGGAAGLACAETLRKENFTGEILMITKEDITPYDRITLSKNFKMTATKAVLKDDEFYQKFGIQVMKNARVTEIQEESNSLVMDRGEKIQYSKLLIASGSKSRIPKPYASAEALENECTIRSVADHQKVKALVETGSNIVIIGGSFLGLESANAIKSAFPDKAVTVLEIETIPLQRIMGPHIGALLRSRAEAKGVKFILGKSPESINSQGSKATSVSVGSSQLPCDLVILATGAQINTEFVPKKFLNEDASVRVSGFLQTEHPDIYAAGDVASFPSVHTGTHSRIEHWAVAQDQGIHAAYNMLGMGTVYTRVPFFWSNQAINIQYVGVGGELGFNESRDVGHKDEGHISYFFKGQRCVGVGVANWPGAALVFKTLFDRGVLPNRQQIEAGKRFKEISEDLKQLSR